eukprot:9260546-Alexandrium_andersonii.AAC.1
MPVGRVLPTPAPPPNKRPPLKAPRARATGEEFPQTRGQAEASRTGSGAPVLLPRTKCHGGST